MFTPQIYPQDHPLWKQPVEKPVECVEKFGFPQAVPGNFKSRQLPNPADFPAVRGKPSCLRHVTSPTQPAPLENKIRRKVESHGEIPHCTPPPPPPTAGKFVKNQQTPPAYD
jgi:hypothetical protein